MKIRLAYPLISDSVVDGPGLRIVLWTQGCPHHCYGCHNPETFDLLAGEEVEVTSIIDMLSTFKLQQGITLSGGEPFLQTNPLSFIAKAAKNLNLDVWCYTGYTWEQLRQVDNIRYYRFETLLKEIDVLVDGKFEIIKKDISLLFKGSSNQRIIDVKKSLENSKVIFIDEYMK